MDTTPLYVLPGSRLIKNRLQFTLVIDDFGIKFMGNYKSNTSLTPWKLNEKFNLNGVETTCRSNPQMELRPKNTKHLNPKLCKTSLTKTRSHSTKNKIPHAQKSKTNRS